ncbi:MAG TPA: copper transporter [Solirubrobacterales bacterium]|jgi:hypothetical protein|nr:copper transporter [Solirubrobacterales bacterium]
MIDFRYHAMSLAAVLVALALGLLLGVTIGDTGLVSNVRGDLERSLSKNLDSAREESSTLRDQIRHQNEFINGAYPQMVEGRLLGDRVGVIGSSGATREVLRDVNEALEPAGATVAFAGEMVAKPRYADLAEKLRVANISGDEILPKDAERLGRVAGRRIARGRSRLALRQFVFSRLSGRYNRTRLYVVVRKPPENDSKSDEAERLDAFERGVVAGLAQGADRVVGVEKSDANPSSIRWYNSLGLSTIDDVEQPAGHYALVLVLGGAKGDYGFKQSADAVIPPVAP